MCIISTELSTPAVAAIKAKTIGIAPFKPMQEINKHFLQLALINGKQHN